MSKKYLFLSFLFLSLGTLTACNNEEQILLENTIQDFKPLQKYSTGRAEEYVVEEKTPAEIAGEVFKKEIGIQNNKETSFEIAGNISEDVFVQAFVIDGNNLPVISGISEDDINKLNNEGSTDVWEEENAKDYNELLENRKIASENKDVTSEKKLENAIKLAQDYQASLKENKED